ncbi:MAG: siphovirus ReqiPepy6 Gp37-like family protein [Mycoplasmoidaceae bacterium]|nr:siphovirus ReqiPepy6 Gp37-like family protein [Mycoplasmoidaceae bacterium]
MKVIEKDSNVTGNGKSIIYANNKYYMLSESPAKVCVSEDLETWTEYNLNSSYLKPQEIAYGNGTFVVVGNAGSTDKTYIYYSKNGSTWTSVEINTGVNFSVHINGLKFVNNRFIIVLGIKYVNSETGAITQTEQWTYTSVNGTSWTKFSNTILGSTNYDIMDIMYNNGLYVKVGCSGGIWTSTNLKSWTKVPSGTTKKLVGISYGKGQFVVVGDSGTILTSKDGKKWQLQDSGVTSYLIRSRYANGMYIAIGYNGTMLQSINGSEWQSIKNRDLKGLLYGMAYDNVNNMMVITGTRYSTSGTIPLFYLTLTRDIGTQDDEDSSLFFYNTNLEMQGIIDSFISLRWRRKYFEAGEFEIVLPVTEKIKSLIDHDMIIMRNNYTEAGIIETIEYDDNGTDETVTISGRFLSSILDRRIVKSKINYTGYVIEGMNTIVNAMTPFTTQWETVIVSMSSPAITFQVTYKNVYEYLCKLSRYSNIGFRIVPNVESKVFMFEVYKGLDRTSEQSTNEIFAFSDDRGNIEKGSMLVSNKDMVNYVLVGGTGEDDERIMVTVTKNKTGFNLHEHFSDQKSLSNKDVTTSKYKEMLTSAGKSELNEGTLKFEVTGMDLGDYKTKWNLGDVVDVKKEEWGISTTYRITEIEEIIEDGKKTIYPTFASPLAEGWED